MTPRQDRRLENAIQIAIVILIGGMAGAASFTHVHDWTMHNSPPGTSGWFGWANAVISELTPTAAGLEIRRRKRARRPVGYPMTVLIAAAALSLTAQVSQATHTTTGWIVAAVPALAFLALTKLVLSGTGTTQPAQPGSHDDTPPAGHTAETGPVPAELLTGARMAAFTHRQATGRDITASDLAAHLAIPGSIAARLIHALDDTATPAAGTPSPVTHVNGTAFSGTRA
jgi:hypothetical protein